MRAQVEINYNFNINSDIVSLDSADDQSDVSNIAPVIDTKSKGFRGFKGFHFAKNKNEWPATADGSYRYYSDEGYKGFISRNLSDANGNISVALSVTFAGDVPNAIYITFDQVCNEFATEIFVTNNQNGNTVTVNNRRYVARIALDSLVLDANPTLTLNIRKWNTPFKSVKITKVSVSYIGIYDTSELLSVESSENLLNQQMQISAGICEQYANVSLYDRSGMLHEFAMLEILLKEQQVSIYAIDDNNNIEYQLGAFNVSAWDVQSNNSIVKLSAIDATQTLDKIYISMLPIKNRTVDDLLTICFAQLKNASWKYIDDDTSTYCKNIKTPNSWCYTGTLLDTLIKVCLLGMLRVYFYIDSFIIARCY